MAGFCGEFVDGGLQADGWDGDDVLEAEEEGEKAVLLEGEFADEQPVKHPVEDVARHATHPVEHEWVVDQGANLAHTKLPHESIADSPYSIGNGLATFNHWR